MEGPQFDEFAFLDVGPRDSYLQGCRVEVYLGDADGEVGADLVGGGGSGGGSIDDFAKGRAADEVRGLEEVVCVPEVLGDVRSERNVARSIFC